MAAPNQIYVQYGNYIHQPGECAYSYNRSAMMTDRKDTYAELWTVEIQGRLVGTGTADIETQLIKLLNAYRRQNQALVINIPGGSSIISLLPQNTINGVRVTRPPVLPSNRLASHVTFLDYAITIEAEIPIVSQVLALKSFKETLSFSGGGPRVTHLETIDTLPIKQQTRRATIYRATQSGQAVGLYRRPQVPSPLWPAALVDAPDYQKDNGTLVGNTQQDLMISWTYRFESAYPLMGEPNRWGY